MNIAWGGGLLNREGLFHSVKGEDHAMKARLINAFKAIPWDEVLESIYTFVAVTAGLWSIMWASINGAGS